MSCRPMEWGGKVDELGNGFESMLETVHLDVHRHINYGRPSDVVANIWIELRARVQELAEMHPRAAKVQIAGVLCRTDRVYELQFGSDAVIHELFS